jgi:hypothetical protein
LFDTRQADQAIGPRAGFGQFESEQSLLGFDDVEEVGLAGLVSGVHGVECLPTLEQQAPTAQALWSKLRAYQDSWSKPGVAPAGGTIDADTLEALKNLGYVE